MSLRISVIAGTLSVAGFMPITASPPPYRSPSRMPEAIALRSSEGSLGCRRDENLPFRPRVSLNLETTLRFDATSIKS